MKKHFTVFPAVFASALFSTSCWAEEPITLSVGKCEIQYREGDSVGELCGTNQQIILSDKSEEKTAIYARIPETAMVLPVGGADNQLYKVIGMDNSIGVDFKLNQQSLNWGEWVKIGETNPANHQNPVDIQLKYRVLGRPNAGVYQVSNGTSPIAQIKIGNKIKNIVVSPVKATIKLKTCRVDAADLNQIIGLQSISLSQISFLGREAKGGEVKIRLNCDDGVEAVAALTDMNNLLNTSDILSIEPSKGSAKGVGIKLYRKHQPGNALKYGPVRDVKFAEHRWALNTQEKKDSLELVANYINKDGKISSGKVNAAVMISLTYY